MTIDLSLPSVDLPADAVEVGRIADAWGVKGWFKVQAFSADASALLATKRWYLQAPERGARAFDGTAELQLRQVREHSGALVAWAQGIDGRDAAQSLRGARVFVPRSAFPKADGDEYYWFDLMGLAVQNREGVALGVVHELLSTGPQTVLVLRAPAAVADGKPVERMIPFVAAYVDQVDLAGRRIVVDWQPDY